MSLSSKRECLARIPGRYQRAGRPPKSRILWEFCATCGYPPKSALRLFNHPLRSAPCKRSGLKVLYDPGAVLPGLLQCVGLASDPLCRKRLQAALPEGLEHYPRPSAPLGEAVKKKRLKIRPAQIDRRQRPSRVPHPKKGLCTPRPGTRRRHPGPTCGGPPDPTQIGSVEADPGAHCDASTGGDYVHSLTFTELYSGGTENRAVGNKRAAAVRVALKALEQTGPYAMKDFHADKGSEFLHRALPQHLTGRDLKRPRTRRRAYRKNDNAHCKQKNWTPGRQLFGLDRFEPPARVAWMNDLSAREWSPFTTPCKPTFKLAKQEQQGGKPQRVSMRPPPRRRINGSWTARTFPKRPG